jgi:hypothetical protein
MDCESDKIAFIIGTKVAIYAEKKWLNDAL